MVRYLDSDGAWTKVEYLDEERNALMEGWVLTRYVGPVQAPNRRAKQTESDGQPQ